MNDIHQHILTCHPDAKILNVHDDYVIIQIKSSNKRTLVLRYERNQKIGHYTSTNIFSNH